MNSKPKMRPVAILLATAMIIAAFLSVLPASVLAADGQITVKVTQGATIGVFRKGSSHFVPFTSYPMLKNTQASDSQYDVYDVTVPLATALHMEACIPGQTIKKAKFFTAQNGSTYTIDLMKLTDWAPVDNGYMDASVYTNLNDSGSIKLSLGGDPFELDTFRVWQAMEGVTANYFIEPNYNFEIYGSSATIERVGTPGRERLKVTAVSEGLSVIKATYDPLELEFSGGSTSKYNAIDPTAVLLIPVYVGSGASFDTGITLRNDFDTVYYDKTASIAKFSFKPLAGSQVRVLDPLKASSFASQSAWSSYTPNSQGVFNVNLKAGRNIIEITNAGSTQYYTVRCKGADVSVENQTSPGSLFSTGDVASIKIKGIETPVQKLAGIYNPGFGAANNGYLRYTDSASTQRDSNKSGQYTMTTTEFSLTYSYPGGDKQTLNGQAYIGVLGSEISAHRTIAAQGAPPNLNAGTQNKTPWYGQMPVITLRSVAPDVTFLAPEVAQNGQFELSVLLARLPEGAKVIEGQILIPQGLKVKSMVPTSSLSGGSLSYNVSNGILRFAYMDEVGGVNLALSSQGSPTAAFTIAFEAEEGAGGGLDWQAVIEALSVRVLTSSQGAPDNYSVDEAKATVNMAVPKPDPIVTARVLYEGDGMDLISDSVQAIAVSFANLENTPDLKFGSETLYYSQELSNSVPTYVTIIDKSANLSTYSSWAAYTKGSTQAAMIKFGDTNEDGYINSQDALNVLSAWLRKTNVPGNKETLEYNVSADGRIDTIDALAIVENYVDQVPFAITAK